jgi:hypothetical protein
MFKAQKKAQDIDLKIPGLSKKELNTLLKSINDALRESGNIGSYRNVLPDDAIVNRYELKKSEENIANAKQVIKNSNREDIFIFMYKGLQDYRSILGIVKDYKMTYRNHLYDRILNDNPTRLLNHADFVLQIKPLDISGNIKKLEKRASNRIDNYQVEKEKFYYDISSKISDASKELKSLILKSKMILSAKEVSEVKVGDIVLHLSYGNILFYKVLSITDSYFDSKQKKYKAIDIFTNIEKMIMSYEIVTTDSDAPIVIDKITNDAHDIFNDIDFNELARKKQSFPKELLLNGKDLISISQSLTKKYQYSLNELDTAYDQLKDLMKDDFIESNKSQAEMKFKRSIQEKDFIVYNSSKYFTYRDKSGYIVDLSKYFDQRIKAVKEISPLIKSAYDQVFSYLQDVENKIKESLQRLIEQEDWEALKTVSDHLQTHSTNSFNRFIEREGLLDIEKFKQGQYSEKKAVEKIQDFISRYGIIRVKSALKENIDDFMLTN